MRKFATTFCLALISVFAFSQSETLLFDARYKISQVNPTDPTTPLIENRIVLIGKNFILEKLLDNFVKDTANARKYYESRFKADPTALPGGVKKYMSERINDYGVDKQVFYDFTQQKAYDFTRMFSKYFYEFSLPVYKWKTSNIKENILGYKCTKAIGTSANGSNWEVWFCRDFNVKHNVYGIDGISGLIIKAKESKYGITLELSSIKEHSDAFKVVSMPKSIAVTKDEMEKLKKEFATDRRKFLDDHRIVL